MKFRDMGIGKGLAGSCVVFIALIVILCIIGFKSVRDSDLRTNEVTGILFQKTMPANAAPSDLTDMQEKGIQAKLGEIAAGNHRARIILLIFSAVALAFGVLVAITLSRNVTLTVDGNTPCKTPTDADLAVQPVKGGKDGFGDTPEEAAQTREHGNSTMNTSVGGVGKTAHKSPEPVKDPGNEAERIGEIVNVINEVADQTNILALNAAIEVARAGNANRGLAAVAHEARKLGEQTGRSAEEIRDIMGGIKSGVEKVVDSMHEAWESVNTGVGLSACAGGALAEISQSAAGLRALVTQVAAAVEQMNSTADGVAKEIELVASVTRDASSSAEQVTRAAIELSTLARSLENSVREFEA